MEWDPASLANNASTNTTVSITGLATGDVCVASHANIGSNKMIMYAHVSATDTAYVTLLNISGGTLDIASGTLKVMCFQQ